MSLSSITALDHIAEAIASAKASENLRALTADDWETVVVTVIAFIGVGL